MDLKKANETYIKLKAELEAEQAKADKTKSFVESYRNKIVIQEGKKAEAQENGSETGVKVATEEIKRLKEEIKRIQEESKAQQEELTKQQEKLETIVHEIKQDPQMKAHLEKVTATKYLRDLKVADAEKQALENRIEQHTKVEKLVDENATMKNHLTGLMGAKLTIKQLQEEISKLDGKNDPTSLNEKTVKENQIKEAESKYARIKNEVMEYIYNHQLGIEEQTIASIVEGKVAVDKKTHQIDIKASIQNNRVAIDKKLQSKNRQIEHYTRGIERLGYTITTPAEEAQKKGQVAEQQGVASTQIAKEPEKEETNKESWWKRAKDKVSSWKWVQKMAKFFTYEVEEEPKQLQEGEKAPKQQESKTTTQAKPEVKQQESKKEFKNSLKYEVVQNIAEEMYKQNLKEAKRELRKETKKEVEPEEAEK